MLKQGSAIGETALAKASAPLKGRVICTNPLLQDTGLGSGGNLNSFTLLLLKPIVTGGVGSLIFTLFIEGFGGAGNQANALQWFLIVLPAIDIGTL